MRPQAERLRCDAATAVWQGRRALQEDLLIARFARDQEFGFAVLADGMGGHAAGEVASAMIVAAVAALIEDRAARPGWSGTTVPPTLREAARAANDDLRARADQSPDMAGMGATLLAPVVFRRRLFWVSVGDSPLFLFRNGRLKRLNEDHSMVPQLDFLMRSGVIPASEGFGHPDRYCLTSVLCGQPIARMDCPDLPIFLEEGDVLIAASDGLLVLTEVEIETLLAATLRLDGDGIAKALMAAVEAAADPEQDNVSICVIRIDAAPVLRRPGPTVPARRTGPLATLWAAATRLSSGSARR